MFGTINVDRIKGQLTEHRITHEKLANELNVSRVTVTNMLNNKAKITAEQIYVIAKLVNRNVEYFFN